MFSRHSSQWRDRSRVSRRILTGLFSISSLRRLLQLSSVHSGYTSETNATRLPSGEKIIGGCTPIASSVTFLTPLPSASATNTWAAPSRVEMNARRRASGLQRGVFSDLSPAISSLAAPPSTGTLQRSAFRRPEDRKSTRLNSSHGYISYAVF